MISRSKLSSYKGIIDYFVKHYGKDAIEPFLDIPILIIPYSLWNKFNFVGYGYCVRKTDLSNLSLMEVASNNNAKNVNVAALGKGVYIVKVAQENGSVVAKRFIKQ